MAEEVDGIDRADAPDIPEAFDRNPGVIRLAM